MEATIRKMTIAVEDDLEASADWPAAKQRIHALARLIEHMVAKELLRDIDEGKPAVLTAERVTRQALFTCFELAVGVPEYFIELAQFYQHEHEASCDIPLRDCVVPVLTNIERIRAGLFNDSDSRSAGAEFESQGERHATSN